MLNTRYNCHILMNVEIPCQSFEIYADIKFHENAPGVVGGGRVVPRGETDRHDESNSRFSQFFEHA